MPASTGQIQGIVLAADDSSINAGVYANNGQATGLLYCDDSPANGVQDVGEEVSGVAVTLFRDLGCDNTTDFVVGVMNTDAAGRVVFAGLPVALAPAPPNPSACYLLNYDTTSSALLGCNTAITAGMQGVMIDTDSPSSPDVVFGVAFGASAVSVPTISWFGLMLLLLGFVVIFWSERKASEN